MGLFAAVPQATTGRDHCGTSSVSSSFLISQESKVIILEVALPLPLNDCDWSNYNFTNTFELIHCELFEMDGRFSDPPAAAL